MVTRTRRGQPLVAIVSLLVGYTVLRTAFWSPLLEIVPTPMLETPLTDMLAASAAPPRSAIQNVPPAVRSQFAILRSPIVTNTHFGSPAPAAASARRSIEQFNSVDIPGHSHSWLTAETGLPRLVHQDPNRMRDPVGTSGDGMSSPIAPSSRTAAVGLFSGDGWVFVRPGVSALPSAAPGSANYGASQAGAILRYALAPESRARPELYGRIAAAIAGPRQQDVAFGLSARPHPDLPVRLHAEARWTRQGEGAQSETLLRPSVFATAGLFAEHPETGITTRGYAQAGFVGGKSGTAFADGQIVTERRVARFDLGDVAVGAGAWGGVQRGAGRLDIGPSASVALRLADSPARLSADYRFRVAGDARPGSGAALTLSAGF